MYLVCSYKIYVTPLHLVFLILPSLFLCETRCFFKALHCRDKSIKVNHCHSSYSLNAFHCSRFQLCCFYILRFIHIKILVTLVYHQHLVINYYNCSCYSTDEVRVIRNYYHYTLEMLKCLLKDLIYGDILMICRLIKNQEVCRFKYHTTGR